ncbi:MAG: hypothetical protein AB7F79_11450 [Steroidobacteraceae bacterium]
MNNDPFHGKSYCDVLHRDFLKRIQRVYNHVECSNWHGEETLPVMLKYLSFYPSTDWYPMHPDMPNWDDLTTSAYFTQSGH